MAARLTRIVASLTFVLAAGSAGAARGQTAPQPRKMAYDPDRPVPAGYRVVHRPRYGLAISGATLFGLTYIPTAAAAWYDSRDGTPLYVVPILGPLFAIPKKTADSCQPGETEYCRNEFGDAIAAFLIADALVQAAGAVMAWRGFAGRDFLVRDQAPAAALLPGRIGSAGYGAWLSGRF